MINRELDFYYWKEKKISNTITKSKMYHFFDILLCMNMAWLEKYFSFSGGIFILHMIILMVKIRERHISYLTKTNFLPLYGAFVGVINQGHSIIINISNFPIDWNKEKTKKCRTIPSSMLTISDLIKQSLN